MGLTIKNKNNYELSDNIANFFTLPLENTTEENNYDKIKEQIYKLDIDSEEKANIINKINLLSTNISIKEKTKIEKEITSFISKHNL